MFSGENCEMFNNLCLPTLDTELWCQSNHILYSFYKKPTRGNTVLQKTTALGANIISFSLRQEVVRRLANTSYNVGQSEKEEIVLKFAQKMVNSDFTQGEVIMTLVQGLTKFENMKWKEQLPVSHANHQPLHLSSIYNRHQRKVDKFLAESTLYLPSNGSDQTWRNKLQSCWKKISGASWKRNLLKPTMVMKVPSTKGGALLKQLEKAEVVMTKVSKYIGKYVEQAGVPLAMMFNKNVSSGKCGREGMLGMTFL